MTTIDPSSTFAFDLWYLIAIHQTGTFFVVHNLGDCVHLSTLRRLYPHVAISTRSQNQCILYLLVASIAVYFWSAAFGG